jgi:hypothetical protein
MGAHWGDPDWEEKTRHVGYTLKCFRKYGHDIGLIGGQIKEKYGECRWYAQPGSGVHSLHDIFKTGHVAYRWCPSRGGKYILIDFLNNLSMFYFSFWPIKKFFIYWQLFWYNVAYWLPMLKYPGQAYNILVEGDGPNLIWFGKRYARYMGLKLGTLDWLIEREKERAEENDGESNN